jgi:hypothetical protein
VGALMGDVFDYVSRLGSRGRVTRPAVGGDLPPGSVSPVQARAVAEEYRAALRQLVRDPVTLRVLEFALLAGYGVGYRDAELACDAPGPWPPEDILVVRVRDALDALIADEEARIRSAVDE